MTQQSSGKRRRRTWTWLEVFLTGMVVWNLLNWALHEFAPPTDETKALAYLALAVSFSACLAVERQT